MFILHILNIPVSYMIDLHYDKSSTPEAINVMKSIGIFSRQFRALNILQVGEKLWIEDYTLHMMINTPYLQGIVRWFYNQNRDQLYLYIDSQFTAYMRLLDQILTFYNKDPLNEVYAKMVNKNNELLEGIVPGLHNLRLTYVDSKKIHNKIYSIIITLKDYYNAILKIQEENNLTTGDDRRKPRRRLPSF
jgi:hypothetical protein